MPKVAVATSSSLAADAASEIIDAGGNAVDAALAAALMTMNTQPGVCALAGGALINIWPASGEPLSLDGYVCVPGLDGDAGERAAAASNVTMGYGGSVTTTIGASSVAVPGTPAAIDVASRQFGRLPVATLLAPTIRATAAGFPLPAACHHYLQYSAKPIFGHDADAMAALHPDGSTLLEAGARMCIPGLSDSLQQLADEGFESFYRGELASRISDHLQSRGALLSREDLRRYEVIQRPALRIELGDWDIALNPPPAIGGSMLGAVLLGLGQRVSVTRMLRLALQYRRRRLDFSSELHDDCRVLLDQARAHPMSLRATVSGATVHTSAVDSDGLACAITASAGYGSGEVAPGTGLWLNNCLGELELNRHGLAAGPAGARLPSNMSPVTARRGQDLLAIGSPGADRITSALAQTLQRFMLCGDSLEAAIERPRVHVEAALAAQQDEYFEETLCYEPGAALTDNEGMLMRAFDQPSMFFGGVGAALYRNASDRLEAAADRRRQGGTCIRAGGAQ